MQRRQATGSGCMAKTQPALETRSTSPASGSSRPSTSTRRSGSSAGGRRPAIGRPGCVATLRKPPAVPTAGAGARGRAATPSEIERHRPRWGERLSVLTKGVPVPALPWMKWSGVGPLLVGTVGIVLVSLTDTVVTATNVAPGVATRSIPTRRWSASAPQISLLDSSRGSPSPSAVAARPWSTSLEPGPNWLAWSVQACSPSCFSFSTTPGRPSSDRPGLCRHRYGSIAHGPRCPPARYAKVRSQGSSW